MGKFGFEAKGAEHLDELATILKHTVMIRYIFCCYSFYIVLC